MTEPALLRNYRAIEYAPELTARLNDWLREHPVVDAETANEAAALRLSANKTLADIEDDRKALVGPMNEAVKAINLDHKTRCIPLRAVHDEVERRLDAFRQIEEDRREALAAEARQEADDARRRAEEAQQANLEASVRAGVGELDVDVAGAATEAHQALAEYKRLDRHAQRTERETVVRFSPGHGERAVSGRNREELVITDMLAALKAIGPTEGITEAILKDARAYRRLKGQLPAGVTATHNRSL
jgi:multidrug efflux pump subunit AcrA (membrane-fusion protein)